MFIIIYLWRVDSKTNTKIDIQKMKFVFVRYETALSLLHYYALNSCFTSSQYLI